MRIYASLFCCALLSSAAWHTATGAPDVVVELTARVTGIDDPTNSLDGLIQVGDEYSGSYSYASTTPPITTAPNSALFRMHGPDATHMRLEHGATVFETEGPNTWAEVSIIAFDEGWGADSIDLDYQQGLRPLSNGAVIHSAHFRFHNFFGQAPITARLPLTPPDLQFWHEKTIKILGDLNGAYFWVDLEIVSVVMETPPPLEISPGKSRFHPQQNFDAMLLLPENSGVISAQASSNGVPLRLSYPGHCMLTQPNSQNRQAILCPGANWALPSAPEAKIDWVVDLLGGARLEESVEWELMR